MPKDSSSEVVVGKVDQSRSARFKAMMKRHPRRKKYVMIAVIVLVLILVGLGGYAFYKSKHKPAPAEYDPYADEIAALLAQPLPKGAAEQMTYYSEVGSNYEASARDLDTKKKKPKLEKAIEYYKKAQEVVDKNAADKDFPVIAFYSSIANDYQQIGDTSKAKEYWQKQIDYLNKSKDSPGNDAGVVDEAIKQAQDKINQL